MDRAACFAPAAAAAEATPTSEPLPQPLLAALLEDPTPLLVGGAHAADTVYEEVPVEWQQPAIRPAAQGARGEAECPEQSPHGSIEKVLHEVSQLFQRPLSFGRLRCFRLHRFTLHGREVAAMMAQLSQFASSHAQDGRAATGLVGEAALRGSNLGGFQDIVDAEHQLMASLRRLFADCVHRAAAADLAEVAASEDDDDDMTPPGDELTQCLASGDHFSGWMNVSGRGAMNMLHNHGTAAYAAVAYTQTPRSLAAACDRGALLLRLSRGSGAKFMEPDEDLHVPRMSVGSPDGGLRSATTATEAEKAAEHLHSVVRYLRVQPQVGSLLVFPGWLPHSVTPHFEASDRVCYASNWG